MRRGLILLLLVAAAAMPMTACQKRVVGRKGIGDPLHHERPRESPRNVVGEKYDDGEFERSR